MFKNLTFILAIAIFASVTLEAQTTLYLRIRTDGYVGSGTADDPYDCSSPAKYDAVLAKYPQNTTFLYWPGTFQTRGWFFRSRTSAGTNCKHIGAGVDQTIIQLVGSSDRNNGDGIIFGTDYDKTCDGFEIHNLTLDCNAYGNPEFTNGLGAVAAINISGSNILIQNVKIINFGSSAVHHECFVVYIYPSTPLKWRTFNNITVDNCTFTSPAAGNKEGMGCVTIASTADVTMTNTAVTNCWFINVTSDFPFSHAFYAQHCTGNYVQGCQVGSYFEPVDYRQTSWRIENNVFEDVQFGALISFHATGKVQDLTFLNNTVLLENIPNTLAAAVMIQEPTGSAIPEAELVNLDVENNLIQAMGTTDFPNGAYRGIQAADGVTETYFIDALKIVNNLFSAGGSKNGNQILVSNAPNFVLQSTINNNVYIDGTSVVTAAQSSPD
jgi:hypothetical protein